MTLHHPQDDTLAETCAAAVKAEFESTDAEIDAAQARLAHLTGICPQCGDSGWWIDDAGYHDCDCINRALELLTAGHAYDAAKAEWQRELYLALGETGLALNYWEPLAKGAPGSLLRELHTAYMAARKAYDDAGEEVADDMPDDESCPDCDGLRGTCRQCQADDTADQRRGDWE